MALHRSNIAIWLRVEPLSCVLELCAMRLLACEEAFSGSD